jgi:hypothetical protein
MASEKTAGWVNINRKYPPDGHSVLVTNNRTAVDAHGNMSHIWVATPHRNGKKNWCAFTEGLRTVESVTHWLPLPTMDGYSRLHNEVLDG